jgi:hypothetical protein
VQGERNLAPKFRRALCFGFIEHLHQALDISAPTELENLAGADSAEGTLRIARTRCYWPSVRRNAFIARLSWCVLRMHSSEPSVDEHRTEQEQEAS